MSRRGNNEQAKSKYVTVGQVLKSKDGGEYIKLDQYNKKLEIAVGGEHTTLEIRDPNESAPEFITGELFVKVGVIMKGKEGGEYIKLGDDASIVVNRQVLNSTTVSMGDPNEGSPDFVLNSLYTKSE